MANSSRSYLSALIFQKSVINCFIFIFMFHYTADVVRKHLETKSRTTTKNKKESQRIEMNSLDEIRLHFIIVFGDVPSMIDHTVNWKISATIVKVQ